MWQRLMIKNGDLIIARPHVATFNGIHNASKTKVFIVLYHRKHKLGLNDGLSVRDIHLQSGVDYDYLRAKLHKWAEWRFLARKPGTNAQGKPVFLYTIAKRGEHFIEDIVPRGVLNRYVQEIKAFRAKQTKSGDDNGDS